MRLATNKPEEQIQFHPQYSPLTAKITEIATRWGFNHLGRFSAWYKDTYSESPYETLQK